jgi:phosphatidylglycerol lysyltransferase
VHRLEKLGATVEVVPRGDVPALMPELRAISGEWLAARRTREKGFSLGFFDERYLAEFPCAVVRQEGRVVAFANVWASGDRSELSVDLMRHRDDAPRDSMELLFVRLMVWGREQGYAWFDLGMAPLSGLQDRALAPFASRLGARVFRHGENLYNFQGLRRYKEKFDPTWSPTYLASPGGLALPAVMTNVAALVSRGLKGVVSR